MEQTQTQPNQLTPHDLTLPGTAIRDMGTWAEDAIKGVGYFFIKKDGEIASVRVDKFRKYDMDVTVDGVQYKWERPAKRTLFFDSAFDAMAAKAEIAQEEKVNILRRFRAGLEEGIERNQARITEFAEKLAASQHPLYELGWSRDVFAAAAEIKILKEALNLFDQGVTIQNIVANFTKQVVSRASSVYNKSTSPTSNLADDYEVSVRANFIDRWKFYTV